MVVPSIVKHAEDCRGMSFGLKAYLIHDIGLCANQEDAFYPPFIKACHYDGTEREEAFFEGVPHAADTLFMVCDGMGGHERGEIASRLVCETMSSFLNLAEAEGRAVDDLTVEEAVAKGLDVLDANDIAEEERKMGTTMTMLKFHGNGVTIAHIGDSRVYHFRPPEGDRNARMLFRTDDHSLVNMLVQSGRLTVQQAEHFPQRNVLTRAMQAGQTERVKPDIYHTSDIRPGDVFCLCSDGMLEGLYDEDLCAMLTNPNYTDERRVQILLNFCKDNNDNHTAWIVRVETVDGGAAVHDAEDGGAEGRCSGFFGALSRWIHGM